MEPPGHLSHDVAGGVDLAGGRLAHHPGGQVHGVAHHRVPAPVLRPNLSCEHRAAVDANLDGQRRVGLDDLPQGQEHPLFVVADDPRRAGAQADLAAVGRDVRIEEANFVAVACVLDDADEPVEPVSSLRGPVGGDHSVELAELKERDRRRPVFGSGVATEHVLSHDRGEAVGDHIVARRGEILARRPFGRRRSAREKDPGSQHGADAATRQLLGCIPTQQDLTRRGEALHRDHLRSRRPSDQQLAM